MIQKKSILLVDDDEIDVMTMERALKDLDITNPLYKMSNGEEALEFLRDKNNPTPGLIILDINMPKMNGLELLRIIKQDDDLKKIPVVMLTTSEDDADKVASYEHSVAGYMIKQMDYPEYVETVRSIKSYWSQSQVAG